MYHHDYQALLKAKQQTFKNLAGPDQEVDFLRVVAREAVQYALTGRGEGSLLAALQVAGEYCPGEENPLTQHKTDLGLNVYRVLDVATAHITPSDNSLLLDLTVCAAEGGPYMAVYVKDCGFFISVTSDPYYLEEKLEYCRRFGFSQAFLDVLRHAHDAHADWLVLDGDGSTTNKLPNFLDEWE